MDFLIFLEGIRNSFLDAFFLLVTNLGEPFLLLMILCTLYWCFNKKSAVHAITACFLSGICANTLKVIFRIERPWILDPNFHAVEKALPKATGYSFPSGHSQTAASIWGTFAWQNRKKKYAFIFVLFILLTAFSRMYLGCHTPKDVIVGLLIGIISVVIVEATAKLFSNPTVELGFVLVFCIITIGCCIYTISLANSNILAFDKAKDTLTMGGAAIGVSLGILVERRFIQFKMPTSWKARVLRLVIGLIIVALTNAVFGHFFKTSLIYSIIKAVILLFVITAGYPFLFMKIRWLNK